MTLPQLSAKNIPQLFLHQADRFQSHQALLCKSKPLNDYKAISWADWAQSVFQVSSALVSWGIKKGDKIAIMSENRPEWTYVDLAGLGIGAVIVPIYPTLALAEVSYVIGHSEASILFVTNSDVAKAFQVKIQEGHACLKKVIYLGDDQPSLGETGVELWNNFLNSGVSREDAAFQYRQCADRVESDQLATIIYTSGTTGPQKGVMLSHKNFLENARMAREFIPLDERDVALSFLPLSHVFERLAGYYFMIQAGATIAYAESILTVPEDIKIVRPTVAAAVPRFYEKVYAKIMEQVRSKSSFAQSLFYWALGVGRQYHDEKKSGHVSLLTKWFFMAANRLVLGKIKAAMGGRIRYFISGGAPLNRELAEFFYAAGVLILEGYGLTETSPVIAVNSERDFEFGTVGKPLPGVEVKIAEDGEILTRGECIMKGYYRDAEATAKVIQDGWFYTGDIGQFDPRGFLRITDRKKDIIVTSGGKNIAPQNIEGELMREALIHQAVLIGDKRNYIVALIVPQKSEVLKRASEEAVSYTSWESLIQDPRVHGWVSDAIDRRMSDKASYEKIKYFALLPKELTLESGELTPTLKVKRRLVMANYADIIEKLYLQGSASQAKPI